MLLEGAQSFFGELAINSYFIATRLTIVRKTGSNKIGDSKGVTQYKHAVCMYVRTSIARQHLHKKWDFRIMVSVSKFRPTSNAAKHVVMRVYSF